MTITSAEAALLGLLTEGDKHPYQIEKDVQFRDMRVLDRAFHVFHLQSHGKAGNPGLCGIQHPKHFTTTNLPYAG
jgi:hypothetical protein